MTTLKIGTLITGYEDDETANRFIPVWEEILKYKYKEHGDIFGFSWVDQESSHIGSGYFKLIEGTNGKLFNPLKISEFYDKFYWGYQYDFEIEFIDNMIQKISSDLNELINYFNE